MMRSMENIFKQRKEDQELPTGFRFHPTDEELINHYLTNKVVDKNFNAIAIAEVNMNKCEPWDFPGLAKMGEAEWYFYCVRDRKYPASLRANRATKAGYWKATGKDKEITKNKAPIGMKKTLVFYKGRAPKGEKTNWVMHEYRLDSNKQGESEWVIFRVYERSPYGKKMKIPRFPQLTNSSPSNSETRTSVGDLSRVASFSEQIQAENHKIEDDSNVVSKETSILSSSSRPFGVIPIGNDTPLVTNQTLPIAHLNGNSEYSGCFLPQKQSILMESNGSNAKQNQNAEFSMGRDFGDIDISSLINNNDMFQRMFGNQELLSTSIGTLDMDSLWNYC